MTQKINLVDVVRHHTIRFAMPEGRASLNTMEAHAGMEISSPEISTEDTAVITVKAKDRSWTGLSAIYEAVHDGNLEGLVRQLRSGAGKIRDEEYDQANRMAHEQSKKFTQMPSSNHYFFIAGVIRMAQGTARDADSNAPAVHYYTRQLKALYELFPEGKNFCISFLVDPDFSGTMPELHQAVWDGNWVKMVQCVGKDPAALTAEFEGKTPRDLAEQRGEFFQLEGIGDLSDLRDTGRHYFAMLDYLEEAQRYPIIF